MAFPEDWTMPDEITVDVVKRVVRERQISIWQVRTCSICGHGLHYVFQGDEIWYTRGCGCGTGPSSPPTPATYEEIVAHLVESDRHYRVQHWNSLVRAGDVPFDESSRPEGAADPPAGEGQSFVLVDELPTALEPAALAAEASTGEPAPTTSPPAQELRMRPPRTFHTEDMIVLGETITAFNDVVEMHGILEQLRASGRLEVEVALLIPETTDGPAVGLSIPGLLELVKAQREVLEKQLQGYGIGVAAEPVIGTKH